MALDIVRIPALSDNYIWLVHDPVSGDTTVIDPALADPVLAEAEARGWRIGQIWNTHWHPDHTGGNAGIKAAVEKAGRNCTITAPAAEAARIPMLDIAVGEGDTVQLGDHVATVWEVPAHTAGHIAYHLPGESAIFIGDTLFAMGCGRLFEGTPAQMFAALQRLAKLPPETRAYCAHEYTLANGRFALHAEPDNAAIAARLAQVERTRAAGEATVPTTIGEELSTNPFMRAPSVSRLGELRGAKDAF